MTKRASGRTRMIGMIVGAVVGASIATAKEATTATQPAPACRQTLEQWRAARFGMFIHWGPVSLSGKEIGWSREGSPQNFVPNKTPADEYDRLYKRFNPTKFDADAWVKLAKDAGMRYLVFTTKHHDGFSMFDSQWTDYKITNSPYGKDVVAALAKACHDAGIMLGFYYSPPDWRHPDYKKPTHDRYLDYMHAQVRELCTKYGPVDIIWFDGLGKPAEFWNARQLVYMIRRLQPQAIINNRAGLPGDFATPEQTVGGFNNEVPWESCITIGHQWSWRPNEQTKTLKQCIQTLVRCAGNDGNLLFNVGPTPTGEIEPDQADRLREMGDWLDKYGQSIYGTRGGPIVGMPGIVTTCKGKRMYVHILDHALVGKRIELPALPATAQKYSIMTPETVTFHHPEGGMAFTVGDANEDADDFLDAIVTLDFDEPVSKMGIVRVTPEPRQDEPEHEHHK